MQSQSEKAAAAYRRIEYKLLACVFAQAQPKGWTLYACSHGDHPLLCANPEDISADYADYADEEENSHSPRSVELARPCDDPSITDELWAEGVRKYFKAESSLGKI